MQSKLFDHDNMKYLKKLLDELESVMDQVETELQRRVEETPGILHLKMAIVLPFVIPESDSNVMLFVLHASFYF